MTGKARLTVAHGARRVKAGSDGRDGPGGAPIYSPRASYRLYNDSSIAKEVPVFRRSIALAFAALVVLAALACGQPKSHEEQVAELRSEYTAELNGFAIKQQPTAEAPEGEMAQEGMGSAEGSQTGAQGPATQGGETVQAGDLSVPASPPVHQSAILDLLVSRKGRQGLDHLTVDIGQEDRQGHEKAHWRAYLDVSSVLPGSGTQISYTLDDIDYQQGDKLYAEVRQPVPAPERGEYREFEESAGAGKGE